MGCSFVADQVAHPAHLNARDTTLAFVSRAPQAEIQGLKERMGWELIPWYTITDDFDKDFGVDEWHGTNAFIRDGDRIFRTYFIDARGDEAMGSTWSYLDITALGRQEEWEDSPEGYPQTPPYQWWNYHDAYGEDRVIAPQEARRRRRRSRVLCRVNARAGEGTRTPDPPLTRRLLYQLSYSGGMACGVRIAACQRARPVASRHRSGMDDGGGYRDAQGNGGSGGGFRLRRRGDRLAHRSRAAPHLHAPEHRGRQRRLPRLELHLAALALHHRDGGLQEEPWCGSGSA